jgi:hypothetical protein
MFMRYMFWPHRAIFREHIFGGESTALCTLSIVLPKYVIIINFGVIGCLFFLSLYANQHKIHVIKRAAHPMVHRAVAVQKIGRTDIL